MTQRVAWCNMGQWPVYVGFTASPDAFKRALKRMKVTEDVPFLSHVRAGATTHAFVKDGGLTFIVTIARTRHSREQVAALIAHECMHVVQGMREELASGDHFDKESEAYLLQHLVQHCLQEMWKTGRSRASRPV